MLQTHRATTIDLETCDIPIQDCAKFDPIQQKITYGITCDVMGLEFYDQFTEDEKYLACSCEILWKKAFLTFARNTTQLFFCISQCMQFLLLELLVKDLLEEQELIRVLFIAIRNLRLLVAIHALLFYLDLHEVTV